MENKSTKFEPITAPQLVRTEKLIEKVFVSVGDLTTELNLKN